LFSFEHQGSYRAVAAAFADRNTSVATWQREPCVAVAVAVVGRAARNHRQNQTAVEERVNTDESAVRFRCDASRFRCDASEHAVGSMLTRTTKK
jgi:hypothetical protein